jgi:hypothetical protein
MYNISVVPHSKGRIYKLKVFENRVLGEDTWASETERNT